MPKRIQMSRQRPWRADNPDAVIVARPSNWGNPFRIGGQVRPSLLMLTEPMKGERMLDIPDAKTAVAFYRKWMRGRLDMQAQVRRHLAGRDLACWCKPGTPCHADVLLEVANGDPS